MQQTGNLIKMRAQQGTVVEYYLDLGDEPIFLNHLLGHKIALSYTDEIYCIKCGRKTSKSFSQGYCFPCFQTAPETEDCVLRPELCRAHEGIARDMEFAESHCLIDHFVYLSQTSAIKVGVTRNTQIPVRWIDQGATQAIIMARTPNRFTAGLIEVALKDFLPDKTNWRNMLTGKITDNRSLPEVKSLMVSNLDGRFTEFITETTKITNLEYPLLKVPEKVNSLNFDTTPQITGTLTGIKGQYLILDNYHVLNIRKFSGYRVCFASE